MDIDVDMAHGSSPYFYAIARDPEYRFLTNVLDHVRSSSIMVCIEGQRALASLYNDKKGEMTMEIIERKLAQNAYASRIEFCHDIATMVSQRLPNASAPIGNTMVQYEHTIHTKCDVDPPERTHHKTMMITASILNQKGRRRAMPNVDADTRTAILETARAKFAELDRSDGTLGVVRKIFKVDKKKKRKCTENAAPENAADVITWDDTTPSHADLFDLTAVLAPHLPVTALKTMRMLYQGRFGEPLKTVPVAVDQAPREMERDSDDELED